MRDKWFRGTDWNPQIEEDFFKRLARAKAHNRPQYLRLQAYHLCTTYPKVALQLLERYLATGDTFHLSSAYLDQARAYIALGDDERTIEAYERALAREIDFPNVKSGAREEFPFWIASRRRADLYPRALELSDPPPVCLFPIQRFQFLATLALIGADVGDTQRAQQFAAQALEVARAESSGLRYHSRLGLVAGKYARVRAVLEKIAAGIRIRRGNEW